MKNNILRSIVAAIAMLFIANRAYAQYYNVDFQTLPNGPIELENQSAVFQPIGDLWFISGDAVDLSSQTFSNVKFLNEFVFDATPDAFTYQGPYAWTAADGNIWAIANASGFLQPSDVANLPLTWMSSDFPGPTASVSPTDMLPYINIGTVSPGPGVHFTEEIEVNADYNYDFISSFVSTTPVPEPPTMFLLALAAVGAVVFVGKHRRDAAV